MEHLRDDGLLSYEEDIYRSLNVGEGQATILNLLSTPSGEQNGEQSAAHSDKHLRPHRA